MTSISAIITAGGIGQRMGASQPKQFMKLLGEPIIVHTIRAFYKHPAIRQVILVVPTSHLQFAEELVQEYFPEEVCLIVPGGNRRQDSVAVGMKAAKFADILVVHDGARPMVSQEIISASIAGARENGAAIAAINVKDTLKSVDGQVVCGTIDRTGLWQAQTPQTVRKDLLQKAYTQAAQDGFQGTDEASLLENMACEVVVVQGSSENIKITLPEDLAVAEAFMLRRQNSGALEMRVGHGYDAHRLVAGRDLILGGVTVPHEMGLLGHSDADVICHALCDAVLGAIAAGDIGRHFPDSDPKYKGISSIELLVQVIGLMKKSGWCLQNVDLTVIAQKPKLAPYLAEMENNLAKACGIKSDAVNLKATTTEELGFTGRQEGISCHGVVMLGK